MTARADWSEALPGRQCDIERLLGRYTAMVSAGVGGVVFLAGREGSGRRHVLRATAAALSQCRLAPTVFAGRFEAGRYLPTPEAPAMMNQAAALLGRVLSAGGIIQPVVGIVGQIVSASATARELLTRIDADGKRGENPITLVPRLLRTVAEERPTVCLIEQADEADEGWWGDVVLALAQEATHELPLLLILSVDEASGGTDSLHVARRLTSRELADWQPLAPAGKQDVEAWIGPAVPAVVAGLRSVTDGRSAWIADLWTDWRRREVVVLPDEVRPRREPRWDFAPGRAELALAPTKDLVMTRLAECLGSGSSLEDREAALLLLAVAALEGRRFTADAVADALPRDRDTVVDLLDDVLVRSEDRPAGIVVELGAVSVSDAAGSRDLWQYEFARRLDWLIIRRYGLTPSESREFSLRLAVALESAYGEQVAAVAGALARLYMTADLYEESRYYEQTVNLGVDDDIIVWRALRLLSVIDSDMSVQERALGAELMTSAAARGQHYLPARQRLAMLNAALDLAEADSACAEALWLRADVYCEQRQLPDAFRDARAALERFANLHDTEGQADAHLALASIYLSEDDREDARTHLENCLAVTVDPRTRSTAWYELARTASEDEHAAARSHLMKALPLQRATRDRQGEASSLAALGFLAYEQEHDEQQARTKYGEALKIAREIHDRGTEAAMLWRLANLDLLARQYEMARRQLVTAVELSLSIEDPMGEARARKDLGRAMVYLGAMRQVNGETGEGLRSAREGLAEIERALELFKELGYAEGEQHTQEALDSLRGIGSPRDSARD